MPDTGDTMSVTEPAASSGVAFGRTAEGHAARLFTLESDVLRVGVTDLGGRLVSIEAPDRAGRRDHVLLGFDDAATFASASGGFGGLLGRYANRIAGGRFSLDGQVFSLARNEGTTTLHGGPAGFHHLVWTVASAAPDRLVLTHRSPDGDQGFPGEVLATATYALDGDTLSLTLEATTTRPTIVNLSTHPYFNLAGPETADMLDHTLEIPAELFLPIDEYSIPTGEIRPVGGTPFDFRAPARLGARVARPDEQILVARGIDHCFVLAMARSAEPHRAARLHDPESGRTLELFTTEPGLQVYTGNKLDGSLVGRGTVYRQSAGVALEPQGFPDAPNHAHFPGQVLRPGEHYRAVSRFRFTAG